MFQNSLNLLTSYLNWKKNLKSSVYEGNCGEHTANIIALT